MKEALENEINRPFMMTFLERVGAVMEGVRSQPCCFDFSFLIHKEIPGFSASCTQD